MGAVLKTAAVFVVQCLAAGVAIGATAEAAALVSDALESRRNKKAEA